MRDPDLVVQAERAAMALEEAWRLWRRKHGLAADLALPVSSYVGYSPAEPWGQPRVMFGMAAEDAEQLTLLLAGHDCVGPVHGAIAGLFEGVPAGGGGPARPESLQIGPGPGRRERPERLRRPQRPDPLDPAEVVEFADPHVSRRSAAVDELGTLDQVDQTGLSEPGALGDEQDGPVYRQAAAAARDAAEARAAAMALEAVEARDAEAALEAAAVRDVIEACDAEAVHDAAAARDAAEARDAAGRHALASDAASGDVTTAKTSARHAAARDAAARDAAASGVTGPDAGSSDAEPRVTQSDPAPQAPDSERGRPAPVPALSADAARQPAGDPAFSRFQLPGESAIPAPRPGDGAPDAPGAPDRPRRGSGLAGPLTLAAAAAWAAAEARIKLTRPDSRATAGLEDPYATPRPTLTRPEAASGATAAAATVPVSALASASVPASGPALAPAQASASVPASGPASVRAASVRASVPVPAPAPTLASGPAAAPVASAGGPETWPGTGEPATGDEAKNPPPANLARRGRPSPLGMARLPRGRRS